MTVAISSPCVRVCAVDGATGLCIGCGRTLKEIASWGALSETERRRIMSELPARLAAGLNRNIAAPEPPV